MSSPARLNGRLRKWLSDYSMIVVLLLLVTAFSLLTIKPQSSSGEEAGRSVVSDAASKLNSDAVVLTEADGQLMCSNGEESSILRFHSFD